MGETPTVGFTGHVNDADTGLTYMQQRYYDPVVGRFLSIDPITSDANTGSSFNRYVYANNNPFANVDPDGRSSKIASLVRLTASGMKRVGRLSKEQAVAARQAGQNVVADTKSVAKQIETAAHNAEDQLKHKGHDLPDGSTGAPHYQTDGKFGHTFWSAVGAGLLSGGDALNTVVDAAELVDPTTYLTSGNSYIAPDGKTVSWDEFIRQVEEKQKRIKVEEKKEVKEKN